MSREAKSVKSLKAYASSVMRDEDVGGFVDELLGESDRASIIVIVSYLDDGLRQALLNRMVPDATKTSPIFAPSGVLGSFSSRIALAEALNLVTPDEAEILQDLRVIRNQCAHCIKPLTLSMPVLRKSVERVFRFEPDPSAIAELDATQLKFRFVGFVMSVRRMIMARNRPNALANALPQRLMTQPSGQGLLGLQDSKP